MSKIVRAFSFLTIFLSVEVFAQIEPEQFTLTRDFLYGKSNEELRLIRNEIFARYGYIFKSPELHEYFSKKQWYSPRFYDVNKSLTSIDRHNVDLIQAFENASKVSKVMSSDSVGNRVFQKIRVTVDDENGSSRDAYRETAITEVGEWTLKEDRLHFGTEGTYNIFTLESQKRPIVFTKYVRDVNLYEHYFETVGREVSMAEAQISTIYPFLNASSRFTFNVEFLEVAAIDNQEFVLIGFSNEGWDEDSNADFLGTLYLYWSTGQLYSMKLFIDGESNTRDYDRHIESHLEILSNDLEFSKYKSRLRASSRSAKSIVDLNFDLKIDLPEANNDHSIIIKIRNGLINGSNQTEQISKI